MPNMPQYHLWISTSSHSINMIRIPSATEHIDQAARKGRKTPLII